MISTQKPGFFTMLPHSEFRIPRMFGKMSVTPSASGVDASGGMGWNNGRLETQARKAMIHRHLNHQELSLAAIDDVIRS